MNSFGIVWSLKWQKEVYVGYLLDLMESKRWTETSWFFSNTNAENEIRSKKWNVFFSTYSFWINGGQLILDVELWRVWDSLRLKMRRFYFDVIIVTNSEKEEMKHLMAEKRRKNYEVELHWNISSKEDGRSTLAIAYSPLRPGTPT